MNEEIIYLNKTERMIAQLLAKKRYRMNRETNTENAKIGPQSNKQTDLEGIASELAFCKLHNIYPDLDIGDRPNFDAILSSGQLVDIKTTIYPTGCLLARTNKKNNPADLYALMIGNFPEYLFVGFATKKMLFKEENIRDFGYGPTYALEQGDLMKKHDNTNLYITIAGIKVLFTD